MIRLNIKSLREFQALTVGMVPNKMLPILSNLKLEDGVRLTKTNIHAVCEAVIVGSGTGPTLLLDERITMGYVNESQAEEVEITWDDVSVYLNDGKTRTFFQREDPTNFPGTPTAPADIEKFTFNKDIIAAINIARNFINDSESGGNFQFVHMGGAYISAFHTHYFYVNGQFAGLPNVLLSNEQAQVITASATELEFYGTANHYFFIAPPNTRYIFTRREGSSPKLDAVIERLNLPGKTFNIMRNDLTGFCNIANMIAETPVSLCTMTQQGMFAHLALEDKNYNRGGARDISVSGSFDEFTFNARLVAPPLKAIPYDILECKTVQNCLIITGQKEHFCFIGMAKNV